MQEELEVEYLKMMFQCLMKEEQENVLKNVEKFLHTKTQEECWSDAEGIVRFRIDIEERMSDLDK